MQFKIATIVLTLAALTSAAALPQGATVELPSFGSPVETRPPAQGVVPTGTVPTDPTALPIACPTNAAGQSTGMTQCGGLGVAVKKCDCGKCVYVNNFFSYCAY